MTGQTEKERFRSFAERYVIERAGRWEIGKEDEGAWTAVQDAKRVYVQIAQAGDAISDRFERTRELYAAGQALQAPPVWRRR